MLTETTGKSLMTALLVCRALAPTFWAWAAAADDHEGSLLRTMVRSHLVHLRKIYDLDRKRVGPSNDI